MLGYIKKKDICKIDFMARQLIRVDVLTVFFIMFVLCRQPAISSYSKSQKWKCVPIRVKFCQGLYYNKTIDVNRKQPDPLIAKTDSQEQMSNHLQYFTPILDKKCSKYFKILLCSVYVPLCDDLFPTPIRACQNLCEEVKKNCYHLFIEHHQKWPDQLNCSLFPEKNVENSMCITGGVGEDEITTNKPRVSGVDGSNSVTKTRLPMDTGNFSSPPWCSSNYMRHVRNYEYISTFGDCSVTCNGKGLFSVSEKHITSRLIIILASLCVFLTTLASILILSHSRKFSLSEKPLIYMVACNFFFSLAYIIHGAKHREDISCFKYGGKSYLRIDGSSNLACTTVFLFTYGFFLAQNVWWVFLCLSWFLRVICKNDDYLIAKFWRCIHLIAWSVPCLLTVVILVLRKIDVDELTGVCYTGSHYSNMSYLRNFVIAPTFTLLVMGVTFLMSGFIHLYQQTSYSNREVGKYDLKIHTATFAVLHSFFAMYILSSYFYEYLNKYDWFEKPREQIPNFYILLFRLVAKFSNSAINSLWIIALVLPSFCSKIFEKLFVNRFYLQRLEQQPIVTSPTENRLMNEARTNETSI